jgi:phage FluMu protein Com
MTISVTCPSCGKVLHAKDAAAGKKAKCPDCGEILQIPELDGSSMFSMRQSMPKKQMTDLAAWIWRMKKPTCRRRAVVSLARLVAK